MTTGIGKEPAPTPEAPRPPVQAGLEPEVIREAKSRQWEKICQLAVCQLDRFMSFEPKVLRGDDPEAIHDMRVASRRLQQIVDVLHPRPQPRRAVRPPELRRPACAR